MEQINKELESTLKSAIVDSLNNYQVNNEDNALGDLYLYFDKEDKTLTFYDDLETELNKIDLNEFLQSVQEPVRLLKRTYKELLPAWEKEGLFDKTFIFKPFTVSLINRDFVVKDELIFVDDETLQITDDLLAGLDKELNDFLENLMK